MVSQPHTAAPMKKVEKNRGPVAAMYQLATLAPVKTKNISPVRSGKKKKTEPRFAKAWKRQAMLDSYQCRLSLFLFLW